MIQYITLLPRIAWRNVWRSKSRSLVVIGAVAVGIWALIFILGFVQGVTRGYIDRAIHLQTSHLQIHEPLFLDDHELRYVIPDASQLRDQIAGIPVVKATSARVLVNAMVSTAHGVRGLQVTGIDPEAEANTTAVAEQVEEGSWFGEGSGNQIMISRTIAEKLKTRLGKKVIVTFQNIDFDITTAAFRVAGIFDTGNKLVDESEAYVRIDDLLPLTDLPEGSGHEIAILLNNIDSTETLQSQMAAAHPDLKVQTFRQISPDLDLYDSQIKINLLVMTIIIMLALIFGIINTMLMAVLERIRELGMLMAIGMTRLRVFLMIVWETVFVAFVGAPLGLLLGFVTIQSLNVNGIDLSVWSKGLAQFGMSPIVYPELDGNSYVFVAVAVIVTALLGSVYPSVKAIRLRPVEALRKL